MADTQQQPDTQQLPERMQQVVLRRRPEGLLSWDDVELVDVALPELAELEALLHN